MTHSLSRELLEWSIRRRLVEHLRVTVLEGHQVVGLSFDAGRSCVNGVRIRSHGQRGSVEDQGVTLRAGLVVDASGRDSQAPRWLEALGMARPRETVVNSFLGYASRCYERPPESTPSWKGIVVQRRQPHGTRSGVLMPLEGDRWIVTLAGAARDYPPNDEDGFLTFARSLDHPIIYEHIKDLAPESPIWSYRRTENRLRHYDQLPRRPEQFIVLGDAACAFNPDYGQGMTVATLGANDLAHCLGKHRASRSMDDLSGFARELPEEPGQDAVATLADGNGRGLSLPGHARTTSGKFATALPLVLRSADRSVRL